MNECVLRPMMFERAIKAAADLRALLLTPDPDRAEILERFWMLDDGILQLVEAVSECPTQAAELINNQYKPFIRQVVDVLNFARVSRFAMIPTVNQACDHVNTYLCEMKRLTDTATAAGAL
jgi:hypothetical protein